MRNSGPIQLLIFLCMALMALASALLLLRPQQISKPEDIAASVSSAVPPILPCDRQQWQAQAENSQGVISAEFRQTLVEALGDCDPGQNATLLVQGAFRPTSVFLHGFPSQAELSADRRTRSTAQALKQLGYSDLQISQFSIQSDQNAISVILVPAD